MTSRAAMGMEIPMGISMRIPMGMGMGVIFHRHSPMGILWGFLINLK